MTSRRTDYAVVVLWLSAYVSIDHLFGLRGLVARHHAGLMDPWLSFLNAVVTPLLAISLTIIWWRQRIATRRRQVRFDVS